MALETLKGINKLGELHGMPFDIIRNSDRPMKDGEVDWQAYDELRKTRPIAIDEENNMISFRIQNGPVKENGVNGCQVDTIIEAAKTILEGLDSKFPCIENQEAITHLGFALRKLEQRRLDREKRGVEGKSEA